MHTLTANVRPVYRSSPQRLHNSFPRIRGPARFTDTPFASTGQFTGRARPVCRSAHPTTPPTGYACRTGTACPHSRTPPRPPPGTSVTPPAVPPGRPHRRGPWHLLYIPDLTGNRSAAHGSARHPATTRAGHPYRPVRRTPRRGAIFGHPARPGGQSPSVAGRRHRTPRSGHRTAGSARRATRPRGDPGTRARRGFRTAAARAADQAGTE